MEVVSGRGFTVYGIYDTHDIFDIYIYEKYVIYMRNI